MTEHDLYKTLVRNNLADKERIRAAAKAAPARRHTARRYLAAAACLLAAIAATTMSIPTARAAVLAFFEDAFDAREYLAADPETRAESPVSAIEALKVDGTAYEGRLEIVNEDYREQIEGRFDMAIDEVLFDGQVIWLTGSFGGTGAVYLTEPWGGGSSTAVLLSQAHWREHTDDAWDPADYDPADGFYREFAEQWMRCSVGQEEWIDCNFAPATEEMDAIFDGEGVDWNDPAVFDIRGRRMADYLAGGGRLRFTVSVGEMLLDSAGSFSQWADEDGRVTLTLNFRVGYCDCGYDDTPGTLFTVEFPPISVDVSGDAVETRGVEFTDAFAALSGEAVLTTMHHDYDTGRVWAENETLSLDGVKMTLRTLSLQPTSSSLTVEYDLPDD